MAGLIKGVPGTDAVSTKHGYYYQDVVTALAWSRLAPGEILQVEIAEDISRSTNDRADVEQVRHVAAKLTLVKALPFIERVLHLKRLNHDQGPINFIYRTTAGVALEKTRGHRVNGGSGIEYWMRVHDGEKPAPLIESLRRAAAKTKQLAPYLDSKKDDEIVSDLIQRIAWATNSPTSDTLKRRLEDQIAIIAQDLSKCSWSEAVALVPAILTHVYEISFKKSEIERQLDFSGLRRLIENLTSKRIGNDEYIRLMEKARIGECAPIEVVDAEVQGRLQKLRITRFLDEASPVETARELAAQVSEGGRLVLAHNDVRSEALAWCARLLSESDETLSMELVMRARSLHDSDICRLVNALLTAKSDPDQAMIEIQSLSGRSSDTVRYGIARRRGKNTGWEWIINARMVPENFDADGNFIILHDQIRQEQWSNALSWWERVPNEDRDSSPSLLWVGAHIVLSVGVQEYAKGRISLGPPTANELGLKDTADAIQARRTAANLFRRFSRWAAEMGLLKLSEASLEYCLTLELEDRSANAQAVAEVRALWSDSSGEFRWLPLALRAGIIIEKEALTKTLDQRAIRYGSLSFEDARARMALAMGTHPKHWIDVWPSVKPYLAPYFNAETLDLFEVEGLSISGKISEARRLIVTSKEISDKEKNHWLSITALTQDEAAIHTLRKDAEVKDSPGAKQALLKALRQANQTEEAVEIAKSLFDASQHHEDAEEYLRLLAKLNRWTEVVLFLDSSPSQLEQSEVLAEMYLDALFRQGRWNDVRSLVQSNAIFASRQRNVELQTAIYSGEWAEIGLALESAAKDGSTSTQELLQMAHLSTSLGRHALAKSFCLSAVHAEPENPALLMSCYWLSVKGRWDDQIDASKWLQRAAELSGDDGPVYKKSIADLVELAPKWRERDQNIANGISNAEVFIGLAARGLNRTIASLTLENIEWNVKQLDPRRRIALSTNAGSKREVPSEIPDSIAIDQTALLILGKLQFLGLLLSTFKKIYLPHSVGAWLFYESNEVQYHQPSKIREAEQLVELVSSKKVEAAKRSIAYSKTLAQEIGEDLALLIHNAGEDRQQKSDTYVVRVAPIHRVSSLLSEEADVERHAGVLRSLQQVVRSLFHFGVTSQDDHDRALAFLAQHDRGWPNDELIPPGSTLYLDDLSVAYVHYLKLWDSLTAAPYTLKIHEDVLRDAHALIEHKANLSLVADTIETARKFIADGHKLGIVECLPLPAKEDDDEPEEAPRFLLRQILDHEKQFDVIIIDDRAANKFPTLTTSGGVNIPLVSSLDLNDVLLRSERIDGVEWRRARAQLRRWGYQFVPVTVDELLTALEKSVIQGSRLIESLEARAIRESLLLAQSSGLLKLPMESHWLLEQHRLLAEAVQAAWSKYENEQQASTYSSWLMELYSWLGYASSMPGDWTASRKRFMDATEVSRLLFLNIPKKKRVAFQGWIEAQYLEELAHAKPLVFEEICVKAKQMLMDISELKCERDLGIPTEQVSEILNSLAKDHFGGLPEIIRNQLNSDDEVMQYLGVSRSMALTVNTDEKPSFDLVQLYAGIRQSLSGSQDVLVRDNRNSEWIIRSTETGPVEIKEQNGTHSFVAEHSRLFSESAERRIAYLSELSEEAGIPLEGLNQWVQIASNGPFDPLLLPELESDLRDSARSMLQNIEKTLQSGRASQADIVPLRRRYFDRLVAPWGGESTVHEYASRLRTRRMKPDLAAQIRDELVWSIHSTLAPIDAVAKLHPSDLRVLVDGLIDHVDLWSLTGVIEAVCRRDDAFTELADVLERCVEVFLNAIDETSGRLRLTCNLAMLVDGLAATSGLFEEKPVYFRRLSSFAHAAIVERCVLKSGIEPSAFADWADAGRLRFHIATLTDLSRSPRWSGFMLSVGQLKQELLGRVVSAFKLGESNISTSKLGTIAFGTESTSLESQMFPLFSTLPGPLEGDIAPPAEVENVFARQIDEAIVSEEINLPIKVTSISHIVGYGSSPVDTADRLADLVRELRAYDFTHEDDEIVHAMLLRASLAAAIARSRVLADSIIQMIYGRVDLPFSLRMIVGLTACAYEEDEANWSRLVGDFIARLAQEPISNDDAEHLLFVATTFADIRPSVCPVLGKVVARLRGFISRGGQQSTSALG